MTAFFVPDTPAGAETDRAYELLRDYTELAAGKPPRPRRIFSVLCRRGGVDTVSHVGVEDPASNERVTAIFDMGDGYAIVWRGGHALVGKRQTYSAQDFD